eukprot:1780836-Rhodomonas_salina.5
MFHPKARLIFVRQCTRIEPKEPDAGPNCMRCEIVCSGGPVHINGQRKQPPALSSFTVNMARTQVTRCTPNQFDSPPIPPPPPAHARDA